MSGRIVARFSGPLHGVVLREEGGSWLTRTFNTQARRLPFSGGEFWGHYDMGQHEAADRFCETVEAFRRTVEGDLRERRRYEADLGAAPSAAEDCVLLETDAACPAQITLHDTASIVSSVLGLPRCPLRIGPIAEREETP